MNFIIGEIHLLLDDELANNPVIILKSDPFGLQPRIRDHFQPDELLNNNQILSSLNFFQAYDFVRFPFDNQRGVVVLPLSDTVNARIQLIHDVISFQ